MLLPLLFVGLTLSPAVGEHIAPSDTVKTPSVTGLEAITHLNLLPPGELTLSSGWVTPPFSDGEGGEGGSGNQTYFGDVMWGISEKVTLLSGIAVNDDPPYAAIRGLRPSQQLVALPFALRTRLLEFGTSREGSAEIGVQAGFEANWLRSDPGLFTVGSDRASTFFMTGAIELPITFRGHQGTSLRWNASLVPSLAYQPSSAMGAPYFGRVARLGGVLDLTLEGGSSFGASLEVPLGPGENLLGREGAYRRTPLWRIGVGLHLTERVTVNGSLTNASGSTPATRHFTQLGSPVTLYSLNLRYAPTIPDRSAVPGGSAAIGGNRGASASDPPGERAPDPESGRDRPRITIPGATTLSYPGQRLDAILDTKSAAGIHLLWAFGSRFQFELLTARIRGAAPEEILEADIGNAWQYRFGPQLQLLSQGDGHPLSLSARMTVGRDVDDQQGYLLGEAIVERLLAKRLRLAFNPLVVQSGGRSLGSLGIGAGLPLGPFSLLTEWRLSLSGEPGVWAGALHLPPTGPIRLDLFATNAGSTLGVGRLLADPAGARMGVRISTDFQVGVP